MSVNAAIDRAALSCTCCGAARGACECWDAAKMDLCGAPGGFGCAAHCPCPRCVENRATGLCRLYVGTGVRHFAWVGDERCLCGREIPATAVWRPALRVRDTECGRCRRVLARIGKG